MARKGEATPHSSRRAANQWRPRQAGDAGRGACSMQCPRGGRFPQAGRGVSTPHSPDLSSGPHGARRRDWPRRKAFELRVPGVLLDAAPTGLLGFSSMVVPVLLRHGQTEIPPGGVLGQPGLSGLLPTLAGQLLSVSRHHRGQKCAVRLVCPPAAGQARACFPFTRWAGRRGPCRPLRSGSRGLDLRHGSSGSSPQTGSRRRSACLRPPHAPQGSVALGVGLRDREVTVTHDDAF